MKKTNRRHFLQYSALVSSGLLTGGSKVLADNLNLQNTYDLDKYDFLMARVKFDTDLVVYDGWNTWPIGDANLLNEFSKVVRCKIKPVPTRPWPQEPKGRNDQFNAVIDFREDYHNYSDYPFAMMTAEGAFTFNNTQKKNLKGYLENGAFLFMDDCISGKGGDFFYRSSYKVLEDIFGKGSVVRIPNDHEVFHNVFDMGDKGMPYINHGQKYGARGLFIDDRLAVFLSSHDMHCGWTRPDWLSYEGYKETIKMGINILMYAMTH